MARQRSSACFGSGIGVSVRARLTILKNQNDVSIIIPAFHEGNAIAPCLERVLKIFDSPEVIVCDGSADEKTRDCAESAGARYLVPENHHRAHAMNAGAASASGDLLLFVHADTILPRAAQQLLDLNLHEFGWGGFWKSFKPNGWWLWWHALTVNFCKLETTGEILGDNAMFVRRDVFEELGGFPEQELFEDVEFSERLREHAERTGLQQKIFWRAATTSSRRFQKHGPFYTVYLMQRCRQWYAQGVDPAEILRRYNELEDSKAASSRSRGVSRA
ncbi:MAG: rSAM/selenodomain-associated transferase 2 [Verrucomicrobiales bacterium]